ncbi:hypothetical protein [Xylophilus sp.]|uniref:hypothetical protein n=1 Tax=Xylophilus sp. TaxID=2653893 RepID=UPI0013BE2450|nr:hypothetical protein [Xylophilus sp.]KAF1048224.1 MAG: hypothetical protein GAK38_01473 [Xylophilus sp.]
MELEIYNAFIKAGVSETDAKAVVESLNREIDRRYNLHAQQLATRGDLQEVRGDLQELRGSLEARLAQTQAELIKWTIGTMFVAVGLFATLTKLWH